MPLPLPVSAAPAEAPPTPEDVAAQALAIESENTRTLYAKLPASFVGLNLAALITVWMFWSVKPLWLIGAWVALDVHGGELAPLAAQPGGPAWYPRPWRGLYFDRSVHRTPEVVIPYRVSP